MKSVSSAAALLVGLMLLTGCSVVVDGAGVPGPNLAPRLLSADEIADVLPTASDLEDLLGEAFAPDGSMRSGGLDGMSDGLDGEDKATPHECVGATTVMQRSTYQDSEVTDTVEQQWDPAPSTGEVLAVDTGVVALRSVADANQLFAEFTDQWQDCEGQTVTLVVESVRGGYLTDKITDVRVANSVLAATIEFGHTLDSSTSRTARAIGVRGNCLVESEVAFYTNAIGESADPESSAIDIARFMLEKVSELN